MGALRQRDEKVQLQEVSLLPEIAERERAERSLAQRAHEQSALYDFANRLHRAGSHEEILDAALECILKALKCQRASIHLFDQASVMRFVRWRGLSDKYRAAVEGHSPWKWDEVEAMPISVEDINTSTIPQSLKSEVEAEGLRPLAFVRW